MHSLRCWLDSTRTRTCNVWTPSVLHELWRDWARWHQCLKTFAEYCPMVVPDKGQACCLHYNQSCGQTASCCCLQHRNLASGASTFRERLLKCWCWTFRFCFAGCWRWTVCLLALSCPQWRPQMESFCSCRWCEPSSLRLFHLKDQFDVIVLRHLLNICQ